MYITPSEFASGFESVRPGLLQAARVFRRCSSEDAEDLVGEVAIYALGHLKDFHCETGRTGLRRWLKSILYHLAREESRAAALQPTTEPLTEVDEAAAAPATSTTRSLAEAVVRLPAARRRLVLEWLDGYSQEQIASRNGLHRNTVAVRLEESFARLRIAFPDPDALRYSTALFDSCSQVSVYRRPKAPWRPWRDRHPPERPITARWRPRGGQ